MSPTLKFRPRQRLFRPSLLILLGFMVLLAVLAVLQFRWITEASNAEQRRLQENLAIATTRFAEDFDSEMRLLSPFRRPGRPGREDFGADDDVLNRLANRYDQWMYASRHPDLVKDFLAAMVIAPGDVRLFAFDPEKQTLQAVDWPPEFSEFHKAAVAESLGQRFPIGRGGRGMERSDLHNVPALAIPVMQPPRPPEFGNTGFDGFRSPPGPKAWEIIRLDPQYLGEVFLPFLVQRHFSKQGDFDYDILIAQSEAGNVVYRSLPGLVLADFQSGSDAKIRLTTMGFGGEPQRRGGPGEGQFGRGGPPPAPAGWDLYAKHHAGSLESFASQFRQRNLAISFGVFAILAIGIVFTFLSSERVRAMGKLQLEFAAGLSHELRTPLTVIRSAGYNLASGKVSKTEDVLHYGKVLEEQGLRLSDMVEQALLFAQTQSGRNRYQRSPVDVVDVIDKAVQSCQAILPKYPCEFTVITDPQLPLAMTDAAAINHCLHNLLVNALKYGSSPGSITITAKPNSTHPEAEIVIEVENRGPGINPLDLPHIFDPFFRGRNTDGVPGSGLGLYIVKSVMESVGGRIAVGSSEGGATRFSLHIPAAGSTGEA